MGDPVLLAQLHRLHAEFGGKLVDDALDRVGRLRPSGTTVGIGRGRVREDTGALEVVGIHLVDGRVHEHAEERDAWRDDLQVGAHVREQGHLESEHLAI